MRLLLAIALMLVHLGITFILAMHMDEYMHWITRFGKQFDDWMPIVSASMIVGSLGIWLVLNMAFSIYYLRLVKD